MLPVNGLPEASIFFVPQYKVPLSAGSNRQVLLCGLSASGSPGYLVTKFLQVQFTPSKHEV